MNNPTQYMNWLEEQLAAIADLPAKEIEANAGKVKAYRERRP